jgi:hypothetical protein
MGKPTSQKKWTHQQLCDKAVGWLKRSFGRQGHGCHVALSEIASGIQSEIPDAVGFRVSEPGRGCTLVEVKLSRADFLADARKPHRDGTTLGIGQWRYYLCPTDLIKAHELPPQWGLLYIDNRGGITVIAGPATEFSGYTYGEEMGRFAHANNVAGEQYILVKALARIGDHEALQKERKQLINDRERFLRRMERAEKQLAVTRHKPHYFKENKCE